MLWPDVEPLIEDTIDDLSSPEEVLRWIEEGYLLLWVVVETFDHRLVGTFLTELHTYQNGRIVEIHSVAGEGFKNWQHLQSDIMTYARSQGAERLRISARRGFTRVMSGWKEEGIVLTKEVPDGTESS